MVMRLKQILWLGIGAVMLCLPAVFNGQPFLFPDTAGYVRSVDFIVTKLVSPELATQWARGARYAADVGVDEEASSEAPDMKPVEPASAEAELPSMASPGTASPNETGSDASDAPDVAESEQDAANAVEPTLWKARSVYYGVLAYVGYVTSQFWLVIFAQGMALAVTVYVFARAAFGLRPPDIAVMLAFLAMLTPAGAAVCYVMPDVFAGIGLVALVTIIAFYDRVSLPQIAALAFVIALSAVTHTATLLLLVLMAVVGATVLILVRWREGFARLRSVIAPTGVVAGSLVVAVLADGAYGAAVKVVLGNSFTGLPIPMAQLIEDGPGDRFIREQCAKPAVTFAVCDFAHVLPIDDSDEFLFSPNPAEGVLMATDPLTQRAIAVEQTRFLLAVLTTYPLDVFQAALSNWWTQMNMFEIDEYNYPPDQKYFWSIEQPPDRTYQALTRSPAYNGLVPTGLASVLFTLVFWISLGGLLFLVVRQAMAAGGRLDAWSLGVSLLVAGIAVNAAVCGVLAGPYDRFGARVAWVAPMAAFTLLLKRYDVRAVLRQIGGRVANARP